MTRKTRHGKQEPRRRPDRSQQPKPAAMRSSEKLAQALEAVGRDDLGRIIERARAGYYGDYTSPLTFPVTQLVADLRWLGLTELADRAARGEFDATDEEAREWARSRDGQATFRELMRRPPPS